MTDVDTLPEPDAKVKVAVATAKLEYLADVLKSYGVVISGAAVITPAFTGRPISTANAIWLIVSLMFVILGLILTPEA